MRSEQSTAFQIGSSASLEDWEEMEDEKRGDTVRAGKGEPTKKTYIAPSVGVSIEFGGDKHSKTQLTSSMQKVCKDCSKEYLVRPEGVKSRSCTGSSCNDCSDLTKCFHGKTEDGWGYLVADVPAGSTSQYYEAEVWARCPKLSLVAQWWFEVVKVVNGRLELYTGKKKTPLSQNPGWTRIAINSEKARVRALFYPSNKAVASHAKIWLEAYQADKGAEACMAVKDCLDVLGDGSAASFKLRNDNKMQLECLSTGRGLALRVKLKCGKWRQCLTRNGKLKQIRSLLGAALNSRKGLLQGTYSTNETRLATEAGICVDPSADDPESWDCDCVEGMMKKCAVEGMAQDLEKCMSSLMCKSASVCSGWKRTHCAGASMVERRQASTKVAVATKGQALTHLDGTMQGKCAEQ